LASAGDGRALGAPQDTTAVSPTPLVLSLDEGERRVRRRVPGADGPKNVRIALRNTGAEPISIAFIFSQPGFEELLRENSVAEGEPVIPLSEAERGQSGAAPLAHGLCTAAVSPPKRTRRCIVSSAASTSVG
jgi:hypothetical protein